MERSIEYKINVTTDFLRGMLEEEPMSCLRFNDQKAEHYIGTPFSPSSTRWVISMQLTKGYSQRTINKRKVILFRANTDGIYQEIAFIPADGLVGVFVSNDFGEVYSRHDKTVFLSRREVVSSQERLLSG